jgi:hypothetical protein
MSELKIGDHNYRIGRIDALKQFHITRRLGPALLVCGISMEMLRGGMKVQQEDLLAVVAPAIEIISKMAEDDVDYVLFACLAACSRQEGDKWAPLTTSDGKKLMYSTLEMPELLQIVVATLRDNLGNFMLGPSGGEPTQS